MRWRIRYQLLVPLLLLLLGVIASSVWIGLASGQRVRRQIETRIREVARNLIEESNYRLTDNVLQQMKRLSGADFFLVRPEGAPLTTLEQSPGALPAAALVHDDWQTLHLGPSVVVAGKTYLCHGIRLRPPRNGETLYILYPESLYRDALWEAIGPVVFLGGGVGLAAMVLALGLGQNLSRRLRELERRTRLIAAGDFSPMPLPRPNDEIRDLTRSVNDMGQKLAHYQQTVQRNERLRLLDQIGGGLAHQLRNGLTGARLAVQLYLQENEEKTDAAALEAALRQLTLLENHLNRFLDLGRSGCRQRVPCSLVELVNEAVALFGPRSRHAGIELRWQAPETSSKLLGDPDQLEQVLLNLLGNALDAAEAQAGLPAGAHAGVRGGWVEIRMGQADGRLWLEVWDSGPGPPAELAGCLFEPFQTGKPEGVGLGLAVSRQIIEAHGGRIRWCRRDGQTCFRIEVPDWMASGAASPRASAPGVRVVPVETLHRHPGG